PPYNGLDDLFLFPALSRKQQTHAAAQLGFPAPARYNRREGGITVRAAHFDCFSGISGDMTLGALIDAGVDAAAIRAGLDSLGLPIKLEVEKVRKGGFAATRATVEAPEEHV